MGISEDQVKLAVERIKHILENESNTITSVYDSGDFQVIIELSNGMNFHLSQGELDYRAEEQIEERKIAMDRHDVRQAIADSYIKTMNADALEGDNSLINSLLMGVCMLPVSQMSDESLVLEYKELFNKDIIINE